MTREERRRLCQSAEAPDRPDVVAGGAEEETPLLGQPRDRLDRLRVQLRPRVTILCFAFIFILEMGVGMSVPPTNEVMETILCRQMHPESTRDSSLPWGQGGPDDPCKDPDVQSYLAMLRGWAYTFEAIPGLLCSVPYGVLSDRWGRKPVALLGVLGLCLTLGFNMVVFLLSDIIPLWVTWFGSIFLFIGGGGQMIVAMLYTYLADVTPVAERATVFFQIAAVYLVSSMIAAPAAGAVMARSDWATLGISLIFMLLGLPLGFAFPETIHLHGPRLHKTGQERTDGHAGGRSTAEEEEEERFNTPSKHSALRKLRSKIRASVIEVNDFVLDNKRVSFLMLSAIFIILGKFVAEILMQYATKRYGWTWSKAALLLTVRSAASLATLLVLLPLASWVCVSRLGMSALSKDIWLARISGILSVIGCLIIAVAANGSMLCVGLVWLSLGAGMSQLTRSLMNSLIEEHHVGIANSIINFMEQVGIMIAGPLLSKSLSIGIELGGPWIGMPFILGAAFVAVATAIAFIFKLPASARSQPGETER